MQVLITSPKGKEGLVEAFQKSGADVVCQLSATVKLIIPTVDEELPFFASSKAYFESQGIKVMVGSEYTIYETRDKAEFSRFCQRHGFKHPHTMQDFVIAKPRFGKGSKGIYRFDRGYVIQEDLSSYPEVSIDYFADWKGFDISIIARYRKEVVDGQSTVFEAVPYLNTSEVMRLGEQLHLVGHNVIQGFLVDKELVFTEVNCRFGGGSPLTFDLFNSPKWLLENL